MIDTSGLIDAVRPHADEAIAKCDFPWPDEYELRIVTNPDRSAGPFASRNGTTGTVWFSDRKWIDGREVIHELAHLVDGFTLTDEQRRYISALLHDWHPCQHAWRGTGGPTDKWSMKPSEAFCELFVLAYSPFEPMKVAQCHIATSAKARALRTLLTIELPMPRRLDRAEVRFG